jgi:hypothetical protein
MNYHANILAFEDRDDRNFEVLAGIMMFQFGMFNAMLVNEILEKYPYVHISIYITMNYFSLFRRLFGGTGNFYMMILFIALCSSSFGAAFKLLKNLEQNLIIQISKK